VQNRLSIKPLTEKPPLDFSRLCPRSDGLLAILDWILEFAPHSPEEKERLDRNRHQLMAANAQRWRDFKVLPKGYALAVHHLQAGEFVFNADHAPAQDLFPDNLLEKHTVYPLYCGKKRVYLLSEDRFNFGFEDEWLSRGQESIEWCPVLADREDILAAITRNRSRSAKATTAVQVGDMAYSDVENLVEIDLAEVQKVNPSNINTTPEQIVHWVLYRSISGLASDLHIEKYYNTARFRARIDGELQIIHSCPEDMLPRFIGLIKNYSNMGQRRQDAQDSRFSMALGKHRIDCRVSAIPCRKDQQKITIRFLDKLDGVKKLGELNLEKEQLEILTETMGRDQGLVLITGPTGSGKTTTLYALLNSINAENINIQTIEDPIEYEIEGLNQTQTDPVNSITFAEGLRRLMRADPDVILIGECRDEETANAAVNAALTGHLVLTTLHANDCLRAVSRLIAMGIPPYLLADSLALTQAQRLVRRLCNYCKRPAPITPEIAEIFRINQVALPEDNQVLYQKVGCPECFGLGYRGRLALMEMCPVDPAMADLVARNAPQSDMRRLALSRGVKTLYQLGLRQVREGNTSIEEVSCLSYTSLKEFQS
jgi:type II secretory ATPase GspE/PulE/Tfp pilus assembly ATPase PilB-like protein